MPRAATDVMQSIIFSAVLDAVEALKAASRGLPNQLVRDLQSIHPNTTFADLPKELQQAITDSVRGAFTRFMKEGYAVANRDAAPPPPRSAPPRRDPAEPRRGPPRKPAGNRPTKPRR